MKLPKICTNKFFLLALSASFAFTVSMYNIADNSIHDVKADFLSNSDEIKEKLDINTQKIENILVSQARIEEKINQITSSTKNRP